MVTLLDRQIKGYKLSEEIARGGFGTVYRAFQSAVNREVAIKVINPHLANQPEFIRRFEAEAQIIARLEHPFIVPLHDYWRDPDGAYLVMRYLGGGSLADYIRKNGHLTIEEAITILSQITQALHVAHRNQIVHRDIKPSNLLLDEDGNGYLSDFGIAKDHATSQSITEPDSFIGSPEYLAPEQALSEPVTPQTDIYSLGIVLYEMLEGQHPFPKVDKITYIYKHLNDPIPDITTLDYEISDSVNTVIQKATAKDPKHRYQTVVDMMQALRDAAQLDVPPTSASLVELLTPREQEVMQLIIDGKTNREIADLLFLAESTVKSYINSIYRKLNVRSRVQAITRARDLDFVIQKPTVNITTGHLPAPENPYKGLQAFNAADAKNFYGRNKLIKKLLSRLGESEEYHRFLAVVGPSGSGKSSVVKAGLIPALWRGDLAGSEKWYIAEMLPGDRPLDELEVALYHVAGAQNLDLRQQLERDERGLLRAADMLLPDDHSELLLVIDQFEEVFTLLDNENQRQHFLSLLYAATTNSRSRVRVIVTLRADYYDRPLQYAEFGDLIRDRVETVLPLNAEELAQTISEPANHQGVTFEDGLVSRIVSDVHYQPGALPLLQYALTELFERRAGRKLTLSAYQDIGGTGGALANRADEIYLELDEDGHEMIRQLFLRLVTLGEGAEDTRRRVTQSELLELTDNHDLMNEVIDLYASSRLLSLDNDPSTRQPTVEVAHEAILREWDRLRQWLNESRDDIRQERAIASAAQEWDKNTHDPSYLLRGGRLEQVEKWQQTTQLIQTPLVRDFIAMSLQQRDIEQEEEIQRQKREKAQEQRSQTLLRVMVTIFALATVISTGFGLFAMTQRNIANAALVDAQQSADEFQSIALSFGAQDALNNSYPDVALALVNEAIQMDNPPFSSELTFLATSSSSWIQQRIDVSPVRAFDSLYLPDGVHVVTTSWDGRVIIWNIDTGEEVQSITLDDSVALHLAIHPDGDLIAFGGRNGILSIWDTQTDELTQLVAGDGRHTAPVFTSDGSQLLTASAGTINIWDVATFTLLRSFEAYPEVDIIPSLALSEDDSLLVTAAHNGRYARIWDVNTGELLQELDHNQWREDGTAWIWDAHFLNNDEWVLSGGEFTVALWNWRTGELLWSIETLGAVFDLALSADEQWFVVGLESSPIAQLYETANGRLVRDYVGHHGVGTYVDISPDGKQFTTIASDGTLVEWPLWWEGTHDVIPLPFSNEPSFAQHPTQPLIAIAPADILVDQATEAIIYIANTETGEIVQELVGHPGLIQSITFSPNGRYLLTGDVAITIPRDEQQVRVWDWESGERILEFSEHEGWVTNIAFNPDGRIVASGDAIGAQIYMWDFETGEIIHHLTEHSGWIQSIVYSPDGNWLYSAGDQGRIYRWNVDTGELDQEYGNQGKDNGRLAMTSDGTRLIGSFAPDNTTFVWDAETGDALHTFNKGGEIDLNHDDTLAIIYSQLEGLITIWDLNTGEEIHRYSAYLPNTYGHITFNSSGDQIISVADGDLIIWDVPTVPVNRTTWVYENRFIPDFTCDQRELYQIEPLCEMDE